MGFPHELTLPRSFFAACRDADLASRAASIGASVSFLEAVTGTTPDKIVATIGGCWGNGLEEYRIGFTLGDSEEVVHGCVWPLVSDEGDDTPVVDEIESLLRAANVGTIVHLEEQLPLEFCDDCGARTSQTAKAKCCTPICPRKRTPVRCTCIEPVGLSPTVASVADGTTVALAFG